MGATGLLINDPAAPPIRATRDVDAIVQVTSRAAYYQLAEQLREKGFREDSSNGAPLCRWLGGSVILDVMPTEENILGFGNPWYKAAADNAGRAVLPSGKIIQLITAPYFLITKLSAFDDRGNGDYLMSHDIEDIVAVLDGRPEVLNEIEQCEVKLRSALAARFQALSQDIRFVEALQGHLPPGATSPGRVSIIINMIKTIAELP